jgi:hypothetical protein
MTPKAFRQFALSLPEATEEPHFERASFRVRKKIFATMTRDGKEAMVRVFPPELVRTLLDEHGDVFFSHGGWTTQNGSLGIKLANAESQMIESLLARSWEHVAPKRALRARDVAEAAATVGGRTRTPKA